MVGLCQVPSQLPANSSGLFGSKPQFASSSFGAPGAAPSSFKRKGASLRGATMSHMMGGNATASSFRGFRAAPQSFGGGASPMQGLMCAQSSGSFGGFGASAAAPAASFGSTQPAASQMFAFGGSAPPPPPPSRAGFEAENREGTCLRSPPSASNRMGTSASFSTEVDSTAQVCSLFFASKPTSHLTRWRGKMSPPANRPTALFPLLQPSLPFSTWRPILLNGTPA